MECSSAVVFVGNDFHRSMFDEQLLFGGNVDRENIAIAGGIGEFRYSSGAFKLAVTPDRVSLDQTEGILSDELLDAANKVAASFDSASAHAVHALGMNVAAIFVQSADGPAGLDFCHGLLNTALVHDLLGYEVRYALPRAVFLRAGVQYDLRLEPHFQSNGANLFLHVNAHQNVTPEENLAKKLEAASHVQPYITELCQRLVDRFGGRSA